MATLPIDRLSLLGSLKCLVKPLQELASQLPTYFGDAGSLALGSVVTEEVIIGMWTRDSSTLPSFSDITEVSLLWFVIVRACGEERKSKWRARRV